MIINMQVFFNNTLSIYLILSTPILKYQGFIYIFCENLEIFGIILLQISINLKTPINNKNYVKENP